MKVAVIISPNWRDYAEKYAEANLKSLVNQTVKPDKLFLIDNESSADSLAFLTNLSQSIIGDNFPVEIITSATNAGFAGGNNLALKVIAKADFDYVALFNMDGRLETDCLEKLLACAETNPTAGAVQARLMLWPDTHLINSLGNVTHFLGFGYCLGYREEWSSSDPTALTVKKIFYPSGAAVLFRTTVLKQIGFFDEEFWMYNEDQDLGWRVWLAGHQVIIEPQAVFYHEYEFSRSVSKYYWMDRNRLLAIIKNYQLKTLILILPALLFMELGLLAFALKGGWLKEKLKIYRYFLSVKNWRYLLRARRASQALRAIPDRELVNLISSKISYQEINSPALKIANLIFSLYWSVVKKLIV